MDKLNEGSESLFNSYRMNPNHSPIEGLSVVEINADYQFTPDLHRHTFHEVFVLLDGEGVHNVDFREVVLRPGTVHFIRAGQLHQIKPTVPMVGFFIMFEYDFFSHFIPDFRPASLSCFHLDESECPVLVEKVDPGASVIKGLYEDAKSGDKQSGLLCVAALMSFLIRAEKLVNPHQSTVETKTPLSRQFLQLLAQSIPPKAKVSDYSADLHVNTNYLNNVVKRDTGKTAGDWIREARVLESKRVLRNTSKTIAVIAEYLGFSDVGYFCRFFKRYTGYRPQEWREL